MIITSLFLLCIIAGSATGWYLADWIKGKPHALRFAAIWFFIEMLGASIWYHLSQ